MIAGRPAATIALYHRRQVQPVDHLDDKPREMPLGKPFIERRRKQKPRRAVKLPEIAHQAHPAGESIAPSYPVRQVRQAASGLIHSDEKVQQWLKRHPRWTFHFTPTSASWLNAVEGFFAKLRRQRLKRGVFRSVTDLQVAINRFVADTNVDPKPFVWTADPKRVLAAVKRGKQTLESVH